MKLLQEQLTRASGMGCVLVAGLVLTWWTVQRSDNEMRVDLLRQAQLVAQAMDVECLQTFAGTPADLQRPEYQRMKAQLCLTRAAIRQCRGIRLIGRASGAGGDARQAGSPEAALLILMDVGTGSEAAPGDLCTKASPRLPGAFDRAGAFVEGPFHGEGGPWISGMVPIVGSQSKTAFAVLGIDIDAGDWNQRLVWAGLPPALLTLVLVGMMGLRKAWLVRSGSRSAASWVSHIEATLVCVVGLFLTLFATWMLRQREERGRELAFGQLAGSRTAEIAAALKVIYRSELASLASFYQHSENITRSEFQSFTSHLAKNPNVQVWEWIPAVPEAQRVRFIEDARAAGLKDFEIWQKDGQGRRVPASGREIYYPVLQARPGTGNEPALGYDLGSDPLRSAALEEAAHSGLVTGSDPLTLVQETGNEKALSILQPVFANEAAGHALRGFVLAALRCGTLLENVSTDDSVLLSCSLLHPGAAAEWLATIRSAAGDSGSELCAARPVMAFGKTFVVTAKAGPEFIALHPASAWLTASFGLLLSGAAAFLVSVLHRRREKLEQLVMMRGSELQESSAHLKAITDCALDAIVMMDAEGHISYWNPAAERILGYTSSEVVGQDLHGLIVPARYRDGFHAGFPRFQETGHGAALGKTLDLEALHKDGQEIPVQISLSAIETNGAWHSVGILRDTSERKLADEALRQATARASEQAAKAELANHAKSEFLANMSHEIRTPMNGVIGMTEQLLDSALTGEQRHCAEVIRDSSEALLNLINGILDLSKIEAGKLDLEVLDFEISTVFNDLTRLFAQQASNKGLEFIASINPDVPRVLRGDPGRLRQVLVNLVGNAVKFTEQGGVTVRVGLADAAPGAVGLRFVVSDTGIGIGADKQALLFEKFSQADVSTTRHYGGTGLGLAISKQLVQLMGGDIGVESTEGIGASFWFTLRLSQPLALTQLSPSTPPPTAPATAKLQNWQGLRALLAEDNLINQKVAVGFLQKLGLRVDVVGDGADACQALTSETYDVVFMDMQMPVMDGLDATRLLRSSQATIQPQVPVIAMTANAMVGARQQCLDAGMNDYITKPVTTHSLAQVLEKWLPPVSNF
ncbi:MAG: CHASE domain-containing protein [Verrucomicrobiota bacterium]